MNKKTIIPIILGIALISLASASTIYAGECLEVNLSELESLDNVVYDVVGNSSNLEGLTIDLNGTIANICTVPNYKPDSFTIIFIDDSTKEVIKEVHHYSSGGGGGSGRTIYKDKNVTEYVYRNVTKYIERDPINVDEDIEDIIEDEEGVSVLWYIFGVVIIFGIGIYLITHGRQKKEEDEDERKNRIS